MNYVPEDPEFEFGKVLCLIDNSYTFTGQLSADWRISWKKMYDWLRYMFEPWEIRFYAGRHEDDSKQQSFFNGISSLGFKTVLVQNHSRTVRVEHPDDPQVQIEKTMWYEKGLGIRMAVDLVTRFYEKSFDTVVLFTGDSSFAYPLQLIEPSGKKIIVVGWRNSVSHSLSSLASRPLLFLDDYREELEKDENNTL